MTADLIFTCANGALSFGDYTLPAKAKKDNFEYQGDLYKVKTFDEITKLEKNGLFAYESVPGTTVRDFIFDVDGVSFSACGKGSTQIIIGLEENVEYKVYINETQVGLMKANMGGKFVLSVELGQDPAYIRIKK